MAIHDVSLKFARDLKAEEPAGIGYGQAHRFQDSWCDARVHRRQFVQRV